MKYLLLLLFAFPLLAAVPNLPTNSVIASTVTIQYGTNLAPTSAVAVINSMIDAKLTGTGISSTTATNIANYVVSASGTVYRAEWVAGDVAGSNYVDSATNGMLKTASDIATVGGLLTSTASNMFIRVVEVAPGRWQHRLPGEE